MGVQPVVSAAPHGALRRLAGPAILGRIDGQTRRHDLADAVQHITGETTAGGDEL
jgi:hypothetical protein